MHLRAFNYEKPSSLTELITLLQGLSPAEYTLMAGGTDVLVKLRHHLIYPKYVISFGRVQELKGIEAGPLSLSLGAMTTLREVASSPIIQHRFSALAMAAARVASPQIRNIGTLGGNICLDTRCAYFNQMNWPGAFTPCFKRGGEVCHQARRGTKCYALFRGDTAPALLAFDAKLHLVGPGGTRVLPLNQFYTNDGFPHHLLLPGEILVRIEIPVKEQRISAYARHSVRGSIDFPLVGVAVSWEHGRGRFRNIRIAATGLSSQPMRLVELERTLEEKEIRADSLSGLEKLVNKIKITHHRDFSSGYRRAILSSLLETALLTS